MGWYGGYAPYVTVAERQAKARRQAEKLKKKFGDLEPVSVSGRTLARSWWGKSWNQNLERYSDYSNRLPRGRSYLTNGMVLDLRIEKETIRGIVAGTSSEPYQITVSIQALSDAHWKRLVETALGKIESLQELLEGKFPEALKELFFTRESGLFPSPKEIQLKCSCPDWAVMCKHVAAVLYGVGARLDASPELFFTLRGVNMDDLIRQVVKQEAQNLLGKTPVQSSRIIQITESNMAELSELFGIRLILNQADAVPSTAPKPRGRPRKAADAATESTSPVKRRRSRNARTG
jgi:uncharacterized Zn finger protein